MTNSRHKYRAWDEDNEIMYYSDKEYDDGYFGFDEGVVVLWLRKTMPQTLDEPAYDVGKPVKDVMQFTGLKDKNGKEIYEGDIVESRNGSPPEYWKKERYAVKCGETADDWSYGPHGTLYVALTYGDEVEVIGNIYEKPELKI